MADIDNLAISGTDGSQSQPVSQPVQESPRQDATGVQSPLPKQPATNERLFTQAELDRIVGRTRNEVREEYYNRGKQEALSQYSNQPSQSSNQSSLGGVNQLNPDEIDKLIEQKIKERSDAQTANQIAYDFIGKMKTGKDKYSDFEETVAQLNLPAHPQMIYWANSLDNTADVVYEIAKNPEKFAAILMLSQTAPDLARRKMQELSNSIKQNEEAKAQPNVREPLSQLKPSALGMDSGSMTVHDLRRQPWLKA